MQGMRYRVQGFRRGARERAEVKDTRRWKKRENEVEKGKDKGFR
jgi:hypothetical protein